MTPTTPSTAIAVPDLVFTDPDASPCQLPGWLPRFDEGRLRA